MISSMLYIFNILSVIYNIHGDLDEQNMDAKRTHKAISH